MASDRCLFRGTTVDWEGNQSLREIGRTPTTTDPIIATLFALECTRHGEAVIYAAQLTEVADLIEPSNVLAELEAEIVLSVSPLEFIRRFSRQMIAVAKARSVLIQWGFRLPEVISSRYQLQKAIEEYRASNSVIGNDLIAQFSAGMEVTNES